VAGVRTALLLAALGLACLPPAAGAEPLSRAQAVARALEANPEIVKSVAEASRLDGLIREARADALPELTVNGSGLRYRDPSLLNSSSFDAFPPDLRDSLRPIPANLFDGGVALHQTLFSFKVGRAIRAARLGSAFGREGIRRTRQEIALAAVRAYDGYVLAREKVRVGEKAVLQKEKHLEMARTRRAAGVATELDVLRSQVDLENQRVVLLRLQGQAEQALGVLNAVMVRPIATPVEPTDGLEYEPVATSLADVSREAMEKRPEVAAASLNERIHEQLVGIAVAEGRPSLELDGSWGYSVREPGHFLESDFSKWSMAVTLKLPVFDGWRTAGRVAQARAERAKAAQDRVALESRIALEAKEAFDRLGVAGRIVEAARLNVDQARRALEMTQANYTHGAATTLDVLDAQAALTLAESNLIEGLYEHAGARATLRYVMGRDVLEAPPAGVPASAATRPAAGAAEGAAAER
jgi:HAE1 family hydrophobic/amphiphilic exporter-1